MPMASSGQLSLGTTAGTDRSIGAAVGGYTNTSNISLKDVSNNTTAGTDPADGAPFEMSEFYNYAEFLPYSKSQYTRESSSGLEGYSSYGYTSYNGFGVAATKFSLYHITSFTAGASGEWKQIWYVRHKTGTGTHRYDNGAGSTGTQNMTANSLYRLCTITFANDSSGNQPYKPDSFRINSTFSASSGQGLGSIMRSFLNGSATYEINPPNTDYTFSNSFSPAEYEELLSSQDECWTGTKTASHTISIVYKKTGYADTTVATYTFGHDHQFVHSGICP